MTSSAYVTQLLGHVVWSHVVILLLTSEVKATERPIISTLEGDVRGTRHTVMNKHVEVFLGIPYAKPPVGDQRFRAPAYHDGWDGVLDASNLPNSCIQVPDTQFGEFFGSTMWNPNTEMSEDCLYLNVWVPRTNAPYRDKSVIVWIYGGGFYSGSSTLEIYDAKYLAVMNDVVVVSIQYRTGSLGFLTLNTGSGSAPGNVGLWDQRMALEWVQRNIQYFSGNASDVTLMGESAGAASVGLFLICDLCRSLFHKAILQSGSPVAPWAVLHKHEMWRRSESLARILGCYRADDTEFMVSCLRTKNATDLVAEDWRASGIQEVAQFPFVPVIDGIFIKRHPKVMLRDGDFHKVPILLGSNENEATFFLVYFTGFFDRKTDSQLSSVQYGDFLNRYAFNKWPYHPSKLNVFGKDAIMFQYRNWINQDDGVANRKSIDRAVSDNAFVCSVNNLAKAYARESQSVYYYWFSHRWSANPWPQWMGVLHADEIWFTFGHPFNHSHSFTEQEKKLSLKMMKYWTNFAKTGNPNHGRDEAEHESEWPRFKHKEQIFINLSADTIERGGVLGQGPRAQECAFWDIYLPKLKEETSDISDAEREWKAEFHAWKTRYIVDWKTQFDNFLYNYQKQMGGSQCSRAPP